MRVFAGLVLLSGVAHAAPLATISEDIDGDGSADTIELEATGQLTIGGKKRVQVRVAPDATKGQLAVSRKDGKSFIVVDITRSQGRQAIVLDAKGRELTRVALGGVGLDAEYSFEIDVTPKGLYRYQTRNGARRCDGKPAYLFAEWFDGTRFGRLTRPPTGVPEKLPVLAAKIDPTPAPPPQLYQARLASVQPGAADAGGLGIPRELDDGKLDTAWREELVASAGEGQFFTFEPRVIAAKAKQIRIVPGHLKTTNRVHRLAVVAASGSWRIEVPDAANEPAGTAYLVELPQPVEGCLTVILESTHGSDRGQTSIAELEVFADGERSGGGDAMLAKIVAEGKPGATNAAAALSRRGAAGATALDAEIAKTTDTEIRRRLIAVLVKIQDPAAAPALARAASESWVRGEALLDVIEALENNGMSSELAALAAKGGLELEARIAAARHLEPSGKGLPLLIQLAGNGPHELRRAVIERLTGAPVDVLIDAATKDADAAASGDLWRALTRHARASEADRPNVLAAMISALATTTDYERRYRLVDGIATLGDAAALKALDARLRALPANASTSALRQVAIAGAGSLPRTEAIGFVLGYAADPDPGVRLAVLSTLATAETDTSNPWHTADGPDGIDRVIVTALSGDAWPDVRRRAATALGTRCQRIGPARALTDAVIKDKDLDVRSDALIALVQCRAGGVDQLLARVWDDDQAPIQLRTQAVGLAVALGDPKLGAILVGKFSRWRGKAIESAEAMALAQAAAASIARLDAPGAAQALTDALDDSAFPEIVSAAAYGLGALGPKCPASAKAKLDAIARSDEQPAAAAKRAAQQCGR